MEVESKYMSPLILDDIIIVESSFKRSVDSLDDIQLGLKINHKINDVSDEKYDIDLEVIVTDNDQISVFVKCIAKFSTTQENKELIERNAIAIMFPYVRSYISIITTQPGMQPIVLPAINIMAMLEDK